MYIDIYNSHFLAYESTINCLDGTRLSLVLFHVFLDLHNFGLSNNCKNYTLCQMRCML